MELNFSKYQGTGNDFILVDELLERCLSALLSRAVVFRRELDL